MTSLAATLNGEEPNVSEQDFRNLRCDFILPGNLRHLFNLLKERAEEPIQTHTHTSIFAFLLADKAGANESFTFTCRQSVTSWYFKTLYEYEAWVSKGGTHGPRHAVDKIELHIRRDADQVDYVKMCANTSYCSKSDTFVASFNTCGPSYLYACMTIQGRSYCTPLTTNA